MIGSYILAKILGVSADDAGLTVLDDSEIICPT